MLCIPVILFNCQLFGRELQYLINTVHSSESVKTVRREAYRCRSPSNSVLVLLSLFAKEYKLIILTVISKIKSFIIEFLQIFHPLLSYFNYWKSFVCYIQVMQGYSSVRGKFWTPCQIPLLIHLLYLSLPCKDVNICIVVHILS